MLYFYNIAIFLLHNPTDSTFRFETRVPRRSSGRDFLLVDGKEQGIEAIQRRTGSFVLRLFNMRLVEIIFTR